MGIEGYAPRGNLRCLSIGTTLPMLKLECELVVSGKFTNFFLSYEHLRPTKYYLLTTNPDPTLLNSSASNHTNN